MDLYLLFYFFLPSSSSSLVPLLLVLLLSSLLLKQHSSSPSSEQSNYISCKLYPLVGNLPHFIRNGHRLLEWSLELLMTSPTGTVVVAPIVFTADPANVEHLSKSRFDVYLKDGRIMESFRDFLGRGIFVVNGEDWREMRRDASYEFNARSLRVFVLGNARRELSERLLPLLSRAERTGLVLDLQDLLHRFAFDNICRMVFDVDPGCLDSSSEQGEQFFHAFEDAMQLSLERAKLPFAWMWKLQSFLRVGSEKRLRKAITIVHGNIDKVVKARRGRERENRGDFLSRFAETSRSDEFIRDIIIDFVMAGSDTTPSALTWLFWILSSKPQVVAKIRDELKQILSNRGGGSKCHGAETLTLEELREMNYLHAAASESLRLYPAVPMMPRECQEDDELPDGIKVKKGWTVMYSSYAMARMERLWGEDCEEFRPERWLDEGGAFQPKNPFTYPVFHAGPRMCMGKDMAYIQMKLIVASVLERFDVEVTEERGKPNHCLSMRMEGGLPVRARLKGRCSN